MREYEQVVCDLEVKSELQEKILDLEKFEEVVVGRELKMIALEKELESLRKGVGGRGRPEADCDAGDRGNDVSRQSGNAGGCEGREPTPRASGDLEIRLRKRDEQRRAMLHIMGI